MDQKPFSVSELTHHIKALLEDELGQIVVRGEISNLATPRSGHVYFNLKDENAQIAGVMFRSVARRTPFELENGLEVVIFGRVTVYEPRGAYQVIVEDIQPLGSGALQFAFEQLKAKLAAEGLFDDHRKRAIPYIPKGIGIVTSATGAAIRDILNILNRRYPSIPVLIHPVPVQGEQAAPAIADAIDMLQPEADVDVIIVGRGGGSIEDLWAFNEEIVARSIFRSRIPIISAVGHETDFTIADFVADLRAPTPSAAAELVVPLKEELIETVNTSFNQLCRAMKRRISNQRETLEAIEKRLRSPMWRLQNYMQRVDELNGRLHHEMNRQITAKRNLLEKTRQTLLFHSPLKTIEKKIMILDDQSQRLVSGIKGIVDHKLNRLKELSHVLDTASPLAVLKRGYSAAVKLSGDKITSVDQVELDERIRHHLGDGYLESDVRKISRSRRRNK